MQQHWGLGIKNLISALDEKGGSLATIAIGTESTRAARRFSHYPQGTPPDPPNQPKLHLDRVSASPVGLPPWLPRLCVRRGSAPSGYAQDRQRRSPYREDAKKGYLEFAKAALAFLVITEGLVQLATIEIGPERRRDINLGIG